MKSIQKVLIITSAVSFVSTVLSAQIIDPLDGTGGISYTTYLINDVSHGAGRGISFTQSGSGLSANYAGTGTDPEQALSLASASSFSTTFGVGNILSVNSSLNSSSATTLDFGLAISANNPVAGAPTTYDSRSAFDWFSISVRPSATAAVGTIRVSYSLSGSVQTGSFHLNPSLSSVTGLYIEWLSGTTFAFGYITGDTLVQDGTLAFGATSTIGSDIGFYGDLRATGTSLGSFSNLSIAPVPEPSTLSLFGMGLVGLAGLIRRKSK